MTEESLQSTLNEIKLTVQFAVYEFTTFYSMGVPSPHKCGNHFQMYLRFSIFQGLNAFSVNGYGVLVCFLLIYIRSKCLA